MKGLIISYKKKNPLPYHLYHDEMKIKIKMITLEFHYVKLIIIQFFIHRI